MRGTRIFFALMLVQVSALAQSDHWSAGSDAFEAGNYELALEEFRAARESGIEGPAIAYNIAVSLYRLGSLDEADREFAAIGRQYPKLAGLAEYNQGLIANRQGDVADARAHFLRSYRSSADDEKIRILASSMLRRIEPSSASTERPVSPDQGWSGSLGGRIGYDDNVALLDELGLPAGASNESPMLDIFAQVESPTIANRGPRLEAGAYLVRYTDAGDFDQSNVTGQLSYVWNLSRFRAEAGTYLAASTLGGDSFDRRVGLDGRLTWFPSGRGTLDVRVGYEDIDEGGPEFAGIAGNRLRLDLLYRWRRGIHGWTARWASEHNDRNAAGVSSSRSIFSIDYRRALGNDLGIRTGIEYRRSKYDELDPVRHENLLTLKLGLFYELADQWFLSADYRYADNETSDPVFTYGRNQLMLGGLFIF